METVALPDSTHFLFKFPLATLPVTVSLAMACVLILWFAKFKIVRDRVVWFGALWMVFALGPVILIVTERTTYLSSAGWAWVAASITIIAWEQSESVLKRRVVSLTVVAMLGANLIALTHRGYWWNQAANLSRDVFSQAKSSLSALPLRENGQIWFVNMPERIEYAYAFGNRVLFAMWLLEEQIGEYDTQVAYVRESHASPDEMVQQALAERGEWALVFYWQDGQIVDLHAP